MTEQDLRRYIRFLITEMKDKDARVPDQLRSPKGKTNPDEKPTHMSHDKDPRKKNTEVDEVNVVGNIVGMTLPLGMSPGEPSVTGTPRKRRKLKHGWK